VQFNKLLCNRLVEVCPNGLIDSVELLQVSKELRLLCEHLRMLGLFGLIILEQAVDVCVVSLRHRRLDKIYASELGGALSIHV
jgi:hypothetical protein